MTGGRRAILYGPVVAYMAVIFVLSAQPEPPLPPGISDKEGHSVGYTGLAITVGRAVAGGLGQPLGVGGLAATWALSAAYGVSDEWHQSFVPGRTADVHDWYADAFGAGIGTVACWAWGIIRSRINV